MTLLSDDRHHFEPVDSGVKDYYERQECRVCGGWDWVIKPQGIGHMSVPRPDERRTG